MTHVASRRHIAAGLLNVMVVEEWAVVALGLALVVGVPSVAALAQRMVERR